MKPRTRLAVLAFLGHGIALKLFTDYQFSQALKRKNVGAVAWTIAATVFAYFRVPDARLLAAASAFLTGHFVWSAYLAWFVYHEPPATP